MKEAALSAVGARLFPGASGSNIPPRRPGRVPRLSLGVATLIALIGITGSLDAQPPRTVLGIECEQFLFNGDWSSLGRYEDNSGAAFLGAGEGAPRPAAAPIIIPKPGNYTLWVRTVDFPKDRPGARSFTLTIGGKANSRPLGQTGKAGWNWEKGDVFSLSAGPVLLTIADNTRAHHGRADAIILSDDPGFVPKGKLDQNKVVLLSQHSASAKPEEPDVLISPVTETPGKAVLAQIANDHLRVSFVPATRGGKPSARPLVEVRAAKGWSKAPVEPSAESYQVLVADNNARMQVSGHFLAKWTQRTRDTVKVEVGGVSVNTARNDGNERVMWNAGQNHEVIVQRVSKVDSNRIQLDFHPTPAGTLQATWELQPGARTIRVQMTIVPAESGQVSLGYHLFNAKPIAEVQELLLPFTVLRKRFPKTPYTQLQAMCPTPVSLMQTATEDGPLTWAVAADPSEIPYEFPNPEKSRFGLHIRSAQGNVQPSIYGPVIGTASARAKRGAPIKFTFRILVQPGDWYAAYRTTADEIFGWRDYRVNGSVSLTDAALNMIDLYLDDQSGGWWERARGPYQIETRNGATQSSPLTAVSLYRLTGDPELYRRRTLPTLEFMLSRDGSHFSPLPEDTGPYPEGSMNGPVKLYGTTTYGGLWEILNRRTPAFRDIALPEGNVRFSSSYSHSQPFEEWLARYLFTGDKDALARAIREADAYITKSITAPPTEELGLTPFFLIQFTPAWEGLLRLYEVTREKRFLDAAASGARLVMTGMWTQPAPVSGNITVHPDGFCHGDLLNRKFHRGADDFRLGWPRKDGDTPEHEAPAWLVSNVGLGFEQPSTYPAPTNGGRMIFQASWAPGFLRLAEMTGDAEFSTYARNATVGRWGNYPGYYITTFTDLMQNPRYPYEGPDMGFIYYHHILVHLSWTLDYLVSDAALRSKGAIRFPGLRQFGYAYFDNLVYGHAPGEIMGEKDAWLWLRRDLVSLDNPQINYLTAHSKDKFFVILMNENRKVETVNVAFQPAKISVGATQFEQAKVMNENKPLQIIANSARVIVEPRGWTALMVEGLNIDVRSHKLFPDPEPSKSPCYLKATTGNGFDVRAAAIQIEPGPWQAYVWATAGSGKLKEISLKWRAGGKSGAIQDVDYPYEFSVPVAAGVTDWQFTVQGIDKDGKPFVVEEKSIGIGAN